MHGLGSFGKKIPEPSTLLYSCFVLPKDHIKWINREKKFNRKYWVIWVFCLTICDYHPCNSHSYKTQQHQVHLYG